MNPKFQEDDRLFLERVTNIIRFDLNDLGFWIYPWPTPLRHNLGLKIERDDPDAWAVGGTPTTNERVGIHFEGVRPGELRLDIEVTPYESRIDERRMQQLARQNVPKEQVMEEVRDHLLGNAEPRQHFEVERGHHKASYPPACEAVRFTIRTSGFADPSEYAAFCLNVVRHVAPLVDAWLATNRGRWTQPVG